MSEAKSDTVPGFDELLKARRRIDGRVARTPVRHEAALDDWLGCETWLKCDHLQRTGAFKLRGATNAVACLQERGIGADVTTHSSGNHGAALALAARAAGRTAWVVMPEDAVPAKIDAVRRFGGEVVLCAPGQAAREAGMAAQVAMGRVPVPPYDHPDIIAGQGTVALELLEQVPELDALITPLGGGGLLAGCAIAVRDRAPGVDVFGAEPAGAADTAASLASGERVTSWTPDTVADGLRAIVGRLNFEVISQHVTDVLLADDQAIERAMRRVFETTGLRIEPSSAVALAALAEHRERFAGRRVGVVITGGNIDYQRFPWLEPSPHTDAVDPGSDDHA